MSLLREAEHDLGNFTEDRENDFASPIEDEEIASVGPAGLDELEVDEVEARGHELAARPRKRKRSDYGNKEMPAVPFASIVKVLVKKAPWTYTAPWRKEMQRACSGSGFLLGANRMVVTGAHVVHRATSVIVQAQVGAQAKYAARVVCVGREVDLAILTIDDDAFWMDKTEVTNAQFKAFVDATGYVTIAERPIDWELMKSSLPPDVPKPADSLLLPGALVFQSNKKVEKHKVFQILKMQIVTLLTHLKGIL